MIPVDGSWRGSGGLHGGRVPAWLLEAAATSAAMRPAALTVSFLRPVDASIPVGFDVEAVHRGRTTETTVVRLSQGDRLRAQATVSSGTTGVGPEVWGPAADLSGRADPEALARFLPPPEVVEFAQHVDIRPLTATVPGVEADEPQYEAWVRMVDPEVAETLGPEGTAAVLLDAMPPGVFALWRQPRPVPTVELTIHFASPTSEPAAWHHVAHGTVWASPSACVDETELRSRAGRLVAVARQTRRIVGDETSRR